MICDALDFAHNQSITLYGKKYTGLVHRDIKPANILLSNHGEVKLTDFGIARPGMVSIHTIDAKVLGTFAYLSPEQLNGEELDQRSDIYSLGTVLYEMLTSHKAFPQKGMGELVQKKVQGDYRPIVAYNPGISRALTQIIQTCMATDRDKRYSTAEILADELRGVLKKLSPETPRDIINNHIDKPFAHISEDHSTIAPLRVLTISLIIGALTAILAITWFRLKKIPPAPALTQWEQPDTATKNNTAPQKDSTEYSLSTLTPRPPQEKTVPEKFVLSSPPPVQKKSPSLPPVPPSSPEPTAFQKGLQAFSNRRYSESIDHFNEALDGSLPDSLRAIASLRVFESYLKRNRPDNARQIAAQRQHDDGQYYLLWGEWYFGKDKYKRAEELFAKAQSVPSRYNPDIKRDAVFFWAKTRYKLYTKKPNMQNRDAAVRALKRFKNTYCTQTSISPLCTTADEILSGLTIE
jgi:serine/threonine protein kinase